MELTQLKYFIEAARTENLSKAAHNLHVSQPSLSKAIQKLEEELGTPLFERNGKHISLSAGGRMFASQIRPIVTEIEAAGEAFRDLTRRSERIVIGVWGHSAQLTECIAEFRRTNADVVIEVRSGIENITRIDIGDFDMLLYSGNDEYFKKYRGYHISNEKYMLAVHKNSPLAMKVSVESRDLNEINCIRLVPSEETDLLCRRCGVVLHNVVETDSMIIQRDLVSAGLGECIVPESESGVFAADSNVRLVRIWDDDFCRDIEICFKREKLLSHAGMKFRRFVTDYFRLSEAEEE